jgi:hypothetical protein
MALAGLETNSMNRNACSSEARTPRMRSSCALTAVGLYLSFTGNARGWFNGAIAPGTR